MATTEQFYLGDGNTTNYTFPFEYITKDDVKVSLNDVDTSEYTYANATTIQFNSAPADQTRIRIYRYTNVEDLKATFSSGSSIRAKDLNDNFQQNNFAVEEIRNYSWDNEIDTIHSDETWDSSDTKIATTAAMDARFQDEATETIESTETWISDDDRVPTTAASDARVDGKIDDAIENDILIDSTGLTKSAAGGQVTLGIGANSVDLDRIKNSDIITTAEQNSGVTAADSNIFTAAGAARRFDTIVQTNNPGNGPWEVGKTWLQNDTDKTVSIWNGSQWVPVASGGAFTELAKVVYVDAVNGDDALLGHRISNPKRTIRAAIEQINAETDAVGNGSVVVVAPGIYAETFPIDIEKNDVSIVGQSLRNCIIHPAIPADDQAAYDVNVPEANELESMFRVNSGTYIANLTLMGMKAAGARGGNPLDTDATHGLPAQQGWNFSFFPGATIRKSPYIQNCTNFSDSQINNVNFTPHVPGEGAAGDLDSAPSGGGILINGATPAANSPLRSMVCDSYTHTALDGPGIFVTNNGYCQATSSYSFFNHYHLKCLNGGQANLAASTTDFGRFSLVADGRSTTNIFTATCQALVNVSDTTIRVSNGTADASWHGSQTRPQANMLISVNGDAQVYPITQSVPQDQATYDLDPDNYTGDWIVTISRPDPLNRSLNQGFSAQVAAASNVQFWLRSMIASSGHTMEYVGSGTDYRALPENGGVPVEANQRIELNNGAIWAAVTDHNGKFSVGDFFEIDQQLGFVNVGVGSLSITELVTDLDVNSFDITEVGSLQFVGGAGAQGTMSWNATEETVDLVTGGATIQLGQEEIVHVRNTSGAVIPDGTAVRFTGTIGATGRITVAPMVADGTVDPIEFLGVTTEEIANNGEGNVTTFGKVRDIDTSAFADGDVLWLDPTVNGGFTATRPASPNLKIAAAVVINSHATTGTIFVRANPGIDLHNNHRVQIQNPDANGNPQVDGQLLVWNNTSSAWENQTPSFVEQTSATGAANIPAGADGDRPTGGDLVAGQFRFNTTSTSFEGYDGTAWGAIGGGGGGFSVSTTPPASPGQGDTYWDSEEGNAYIYYEDGTSNQWVPLVPSTPPKNATGGGTDEVFFENDNAVTTNYTLQTGKNALSAGPITINSGVTVTVPSGQSWVIV
jgi:hypothetical protein